MKVIFPLIALLLLFLGCREDIITSPEDGTGSFTVTSSPQGAEIFINNQSTNSLTPEHFTEVSPGEYNVKLSHPGFFDTTVVISVESGKRELINVSLTYAF